MPTDCVPGIPSVLRADVLPANMTPGYSRAVNHLLALPEALLREVVSWSPDSSTVNALLNSCRSTCRVRHDPAAGALLLVRCRSHDYGHALHSCASTCQGGMAAVVQQLMQLMQAGADSGGHFTAPASLVQHLLWLACSTGAPHFVAALLALQPAPSLDERRGMALKISLCSNHVSTTRALLNAGADPSIADMACIKWAAVAPDKAWALQLLLTHCPAAALPAAVQAALDHAITAGNVEPLPFLLSQARAAGLATEQFFRLAVQQNRAAVLLLLLRFADIRGLRRAWPSTCVWPSSAAVSAASAAVLLDCGADVARSNQQELLLSLTWWGAREDPVTVAKRQETVALLLQRGAVVTPAVQAAAEEAGWAYMLALPAPPADAGA